MIKINELKRGFELFQDEYEDKALQVLRSGWYILGQEVKCFEEEFAKFVGSRYCIGVDNGLNAIYLGIKALEIGRGDEVIVAANTYIATVLGASLNGAKPVFVDANEYHNIDETKIEMAITSKTKALLVTHLYGQPCKMDVITEICRRKKIHLLEDCAQAHGATYQGKSVGTFGILGFYSFYPTKNIGAFGDAGAIVTDDKVLTEKIRALRNYGSIARYQNEYEGNNSRLDEIQAGLLRVKLTHANYLISKRIENAGEYIRRINNCRISMPKTIEHARHVYHLFVVRVDNRQKFREYMEKKGIQTDVHYPTPPYLAKPYLELGYLKGDFPMTEALYSNIVSIPLFDGITPQEIDEIVEAMNSYE